MKRISTWMLRNTLKRKVFSFILVLLLCFLSGFIYTFYVTFRVNEQINEMFSTSISLKAMNEEMRAFESHLETYLASKNSDSFVQYLDTYNLLNARSKAIIAGESPYASNLQLKNIGHLLEAYLDTSEKAIEYKRGRNTEGYLDAYGDLLNIGGYIEHKVSRLEALDFEVNLENYQQLTAQFAEIQTNLVIIAILLIALSVIFVFTFSVGVATPIVDLSEQAQAIASGDYHVKRVKGTHFKEAELLRDTFYDMASHIQEYIDELKDKVETENKLRLSETEKLKIQNSLNQAELMALQSQINPHFLFNTLNAGMQLAIIEDAERTGHFLEVLSALFRYNIQSLQNKVKLSQEFENAQKYYELMKVRFGDQFTFRFQCSPEVAGTEMPPLILQPIIENALIHGFRNKTESGLIDIRAYLSGEHVCVEVLDNGEGITETDLERLNRGDFTKVSDRVGHTTGLGLGNVYERLRHFFGVGEIMVFESVVSSHTKVTIRLPRKESESC